MSLSILVFAVPLIEFGSVYPAVHHNESHDDCGRDTSGFEQLVGFPLRMSIAFGWAAPGAIALLGVPGLCLQLTPNKLELRRCNAIIRV
jgi:hypothetical protein